MGLRVRDLGVSFEISIGILSLFLTAFVRTLQVGRLNVRGTASHRDLLDSDLAGQDAYLLEYYYLFQCRPRVFHRRGLVIGLAIGLGFVRDWVLFRYRTSFVFTVRVRATPSVVSRNVGRRADLSGHWELDIPRSVLTKAFRVFTLGQRQKLVTLIVFERAFASSFRCI